MLQEVVTDLMRQIQELRSSINDKTESIDGLTRELEDMNVCSVILKDMVYSFSEMEGNDMSYHGSQTA